MSSRLGIVMPVAVIAVGAVLTGCSSLSSSSSAPPASTTGSSAAAPPASSAAGGAGSAAAASSSSQATSGSTKQGTSGGGSQAVSAAGGSGSGAGAAAWCTAAQLKISYTDNSQINNGALDGMSHVDRVVTFTNAGSTRCETGGYPGVAALDSSGKQIKQAVRSTDTSKTITLAPGAVASALVSANSASCDTLTDAAGLLVTAPNERTSVRLGSPGSFCLGSLQVGPLKPGNAAGLQV